MCGINRKSQVRRRLTQSRGETLCLQKSDIYCVSFVLAISPINMESEYVIQGDTRVASMPNSGASKCICYRPHSNIICNCCGFWTKGRVRHCCPQHPKIVFLYDYAQCPRCKSYDFMLTEI